MDPSLLRTQPHSGNIFHITLWFEFWYKNPAWYTSSTVSPQSQLIPTVFGHLGSKYKMKLQLQFYECQEVGFQLFALYPEVKLADLKDTLPCGNTDTRCGSCVRRESRDNVWQHKRAVNKILGIGMISELVLNDLLPQLPWLVRSSIVIHIHTGVIWWRVKLNVHLFPYRDKIISIRK